MRPAGLLQPLPVPERIWNDVSIDYVEEFPISNGFSVVMLVVDRLSKYAYFVPIRHPFTASSVAQEFISNIFHLYGVPLTIVQAVDDYLQDMDLLLKTLRTNLLDAQNRMKQFADRHGRELAYEVGDYVYVKLQPYRESRMVSRSLAKLSPRFFSPYKILANLGSVVYRLELRQGSLVHNMFHVSLLRKSEVSIPEPFPLFISEPSKSTAELQPEHILEERVVQRGKYRPKMEILVQWEGQTPENTTWENKWHFTHIFPQFHLEARVFSGIDGGIGRGALITAIGGIGSSNLSMGISDSIVGVGVEIHANLSSSIDGHFNYGIRGGSIGVALVVALLVALDVALVTYGWLL
ncbi:uncharacterized protein LOC141666109 [Apium graveolens]|uniref:uncharacterized protein LOC141666109 n=1 Tax=Apium graveolens TaxID=4045 RepID=UPI003D7BAC3E